MFLNRPRQIIWKATCRCFIDEISQQFVMLALARMNRLSKASTVGSNPNSSTSNDEHASGMVNSEKMLLLNANIGQEPTTPCVLNTPNTCTITSTFFYDIPSSVPTSTSNGKFFFASGSLLFAKWGEKGKERVFQILPMFASLNSSLASSCRWIWIADARAQRNCQSEFFLKRWLPSISYLS